MTPRAHSSKQSPRTPHTSPDGPATAKGQNKKERPMPTMIFVNLPVESLERSAAFYNKLGFPTNPQFSDQNATNAVISDTIVLMLLVKPFFQGFINKEIADPATSTTAII